MSHHPVSPPTDPALVGHGAEPRDAGFHAALARIGRLALEAPPLPDLYREAADAASRSLEVEFGGIFERVPDADDLRLVAGVGWRDEVVGRAVLEGESGSQAGYTLRRGEPVAVRDLERESRFRASGLLREHGVVSGLTCVIPGRDGPWGVLGVHGTDVRTFGDPEVTFLQGVANALGSAIDQARARARLEGEERFRTIAEQVDQVFWIMAPDGDRVEYVSPAYSELWGRDPAGLEANPAAWMEAIHREDRGPVREALSRRAEGTYDVEYRVVRPDGSVRWVWDRAFPLRDEDGHARRIVGVTADVTDRKELERHLQRVQRLEGIGRLAGGIAHDFNNVLTVVRGHARLLLDDLPAESPLVSDVRRILDVTERAVSLTRQLLAFSREQVLQEQVLDLDRFVGGLEAMLRRLVPDGVGFVLDTRDGDVRVKADPAQLQQVVLNLALNAADAVEEDGRITVRVDATTLSEERARKLPWSADPGAYARLTVEDTGAGMPPGVLDRIFEPFFTTKPDGEGSGLGLPTVYGIVKQSGGHILVDSEVGEGSTVQVLLPLVHEQEESEEHGRAPSADPERTTGAESAGGEADPAKGIVLLVEDEAGVRHVARRVLERLGYTVLEAKDGEEALRVAEGRLEEVDVVVSDVVMPGMDGVALLDRLRRLRPDVRTILVSGYCEEELRDGAWREPAGFLNKPFSPEELARAIQEVRAN